MKTASHAGWKLPAFITGLAIIGFAVSTFSARHISEEAAALIGIVCLVMFAYGIASILWLWRETVFHAGGPVLLFIGLGILIASCAAGLLAGIIAGGLIAITGAVLCLKK